MLGMCLIIIIKLVILQNQMKMMNIYILLSLLVECLVISQKGKILFIYVEQSGFYIQQKD